MNLAHTIRLFVVRFVFLCLSYYCTFVHTLVLCKVADHQPVGIKIFCDVFFGGGGCLYQTMLLLYIPLSQ